MLLFCTCALSLSLLKIYTLIHNARLSICVSICGITSHDQMIKAQLTQRPAFQISRPCPCWKLCSSMPTSPLPSVSCGTLHYSFYSPRWRCSNHRRSTRRASSSFYSGLLRSRSCLGLLLISDVIAAMTSRVMTRPSSCCKIGLFALFVTFASKLNELSR